MIAKLKTKTLYFITTPLFLAVPLSLLVLILLPPLFMRYKGDIEDIVYQNTDKMWKTYYIDLDYDAYSEKVETYLWNDNTSNIRIWKHDGTFVDEYRFDGLNHYHFDLLHGDYNNNKHQELYIFTIEDSLLYLNHLEVLSDTNYTRKKIFVDSLHFHNNTLDSRIHKVGLADLDQDGYKEIIFYITTGYALQPRNLCAWNIKKNRILKSPKSYASTIICKLEDIDQDGVLEIYGALCNAPGNTSGNLITPYHDQSAWLMIYDNNLQFKYPPIEYKNYGSRCRMAILKQNGKNYVFAFANNFIAGKQYSDLYLFNEHLNLIRQKKLDLYGPYDGVYKIKVKGKEKILLIDYKKEGMVYEIDTNLNVLEKIKISHRVSNYKDIDIDGSDEMIAFDMANNTFIIRRWNFKYPVYYKLKEPQGITYRVMTIRKNGNGHLQLSLQIGNRHYLLNYVKNPYYLLKYPFYLLLYAVFVLFFYFVQKIQKKRIEQKYAHERELAKLQIQTIKNQTDPHFIFNALNSISSAIYREDKDTAYNFLTDFSSLIRAAIINSDKIQISLQEEIDFIENYLRLEKLRFKEKFDFKIDIDNQVDKNTNVPRMVLQSYIENAIKHGIMHTDHKGLLEITIKNENNHLDITIDDNGIGREKAKEFSAMSTGKGLLIMNRIYELYYKLHKVKITQTIEDKKDDKGNGIGTRVKIEIPLNEINSS